MKDQKRNQERPWLDSNEDILSDESIKNISVCWTTEIWERFLDETVSSGVRESQITDEAFDKILESNIEPLFSTSSNSKLDPEIVKHIHQIRSHKLTPNQRQVIDLTFWNDLPERDIADKMEICRSAVIALRNRSLNKFKRFLPKTVSIYPRVQETKRFAPRKEKSRDEQINDVYQQDLRTPKLML